MKRLIGCVLFLLMPAVALAAPLSGKFQSPLGFLSIKEAADGTVTGSITDAKNPCGFPKGTAVLNGARLDDSCVAGTFKACKLMTDTCAGFIQGDAILLVSKGGALLSGTVHLDGRGCQTPLTGDALVLKKSGSGAPPKPPAPPPKPQHDQSEQLAKDAHALIMAGEAEEARKKCQEAVKLDPGFSQGYTCLGVTYYLRERYDEAFEQYAKALEADPANRDVYYNMASIYAIQGKIDESLQYLKLSVLNGYIDLPTLSSDNDLKNLHGNAEFERIKSGQLE
jgi:TPR repeat